MPRTIPVEEQTLPYLDFPSHESMDAHSRHIIGRALDDADGNQTKAADRLRLQGTYLARLIKQQKEKGQNGDQE